MSQDKGRGERETADEEEDDDAEPFTPTPWQDEVRATVRRLLIPAKPGAPVPLTVGEWLEKIPSWTMEEWREWNKTPGFREWWHSLIPQTQAPAVEDFDALEGALVRFLSQTMTDGRQSIKERIKAASIAQRVIRTHKQAQLAGRQDAPEEGGQRGDPSQQMVEWMQGTPEAGWLNGGTTPES